MTLLLTVFYDRIGDVEHADDIAPCLHVDRDHGLLLLSAMLGGGSSLFLAINGILNNISIQFYKSTFQYTYEELAIRAHQSRS